MALVTPSNGLRYQCHFRDEKCWQKGWFVPQRTVSLPLPLAMHAFVEKFSQNIPWGGKFTTATQVMNYRVPCTPAVAIYMSSIFISPANGSSTSTYVMVEHAYLPSKGGEDHFQSLYES